MSFRNMAALGGLALLVLLGLGFLLFGTDLKMDIDLLSVWIADMGRWGPALLVVLMILHCFIPFPAEILALSAGAIYGLVTGTILIWIGAMMGAALSFGLARNLGREAVERMLPKRYVSTLDDWTADQGATTLLISRFIPVIAFNLINYAAGLTRVTWWTFLWTTGLGILPLTTIMVYLGTTMRELSWPLLLMVSAVGIVLICGLHWALKRNRQQRSAK